MKIKKVFHGSIKYLRELSVVVVGISITFLANNCLNNSKDKKDLQQYMDMIYLELESNHNIVLGMSYYFGQVDSLGMYLRSVKQEQVEKDSLVKYRDALGIWLLNYNKNAFEMFKTSGTMRLIKDKSFSKSIMDCYSNMELTAVYHDLFLNARKDIVTDLLLNTPEPFSIDLIIDLFSTPQCKHIYNFYSSPDQFHQVFQGLADNIKTIFDQFPK